MILHDVSRSGAAFLRRSIVLVLLLLLACTTALAAPDDASPTLDALTLSTEAVAPLRFVAAHGERAAMMGYGRQGLEMWAYPVQLFRDYRIAIRPEGAATAVPGEQLLRRIEARPWDTTRVYVGADFVVRERIFVPRDRPGVAITYTVEGRRPVDIVVQFTPVLDLMWPAAIGGQSAQWQDALHGYLLEEPLHRFRAAIISPNIAAHDPTENAAVRPAGLALTLAPAKQPDGSRQATLYAALDPEGTAEPGAGAKDLAAQQAALEAAAREHYAALLKDTLQVETPDARVNHALAWAEIALDQAWVCNPRLGCGVVAGYGPSRPGRRPQYDWFFAGDGLIATDGLAAAGEYARARQELEFILKYQDAKTGMIWHELSQSAGYLDWIGKYPYMFVHVDITFQFLGAVARYVSTSGDAGFAREHWNQIAQAYRYCAATIDPATHLPRIPAGKEGGNEQDRLSDDLGLSASWLDAAEGFSRVASAAGHQPEAAEAHAAAEAARPAIAARYWNPVRQFWISGHTDDGRAVNEERSEASDLLSGNVFSAGQRKVLLDKLAGAEFQTDWGTRNVSAAAPSYDPDAYARGSVFALHTAGMAAAYWQAHRPVTALAIWNTLPPQTDLDALGHLHEVLAGDFYHQQAESVAEQTWSSAGFLDASVHGLLGLDVRAGDNRIRFAPHLPPDWDRVTLRNIRTADGTVALKLEREAGEISLESTNQGAPVTLVFAPDLPLGAGQVAAECDGRSVRATLEPNAQDQHARIEAPLRAGTTRCTIRYRGGIEIVPDAPRLEAGAASHAIKVTGVALAGNILTVAADVNRDGDAGFDLKAEGAPMALEGGAVSPVSSKRFRITFTRQNSPADASRAGYAHQVVRLRIEGLR